MDKKIIVIAGPTAVGKTKYSIEIAQALNGEIVSCDSMQLYKYMDIGSAKPTVEERKQVKHYLIDEIDPKEPFSVAAYKKLAQKAIKEIFAKGKTPVITGGTGLYLNSLLYNMDFGNTKTNFEYRSKLEKILEEKGAEFLYDLLKEKDPSSADRIHKNNTQRVMRALETIEISGKGLNDFQNVTEKNPDYETTLIGLERNREELYARINLRVDILIKEGLVNEVEMLMKKGFTAKDISMKGIGYKEIIDFLNGEYNEERAIELVKRNTRRYAKRQMTWFKRYEDMKWFNLSSYANEKKSIEEIILWLQKNN